MNLSLKKSQSQTIYTLSESGEEKANTYLQFKANEREEAENKCMMFLKAKKYKQALMATAEFEAKQVFLRGMGIDWNRYNPKSDIAILKTIFNSKPKILKDVTDDVLQHLRFAAAMTKIWGLSDGRKWLPKDFKSYLTLKDDVAIRMVMFFGYGQRNLAQYKSIDTIKEIKISCTDTSCPECKKLAGKKFKIENAPELPHEGCTHDMGCRCAYHAIIPGLND